MSFILRYVRVALATTDVNSLISILEIPVPDEIHMEDRNYRFSRSIKERLKGSALNHIHTFTPPGGEVLPYMGYIGMCGPKGYGFSAVLVINRVSNIADSGHK